MAWTTDEQARSQSTETAFSGTKEGDFATDGMGVRRECTHKMPAGRVGGGGALGAPRRQGVLEHVVRAEESGK